MPTVFNDDLFVALNNGILIKFIAVPKTDSTLLKNLH